LKFKIAQVPGLDQNRISPLPHKRSKIILHKTVPQAGKSDFFSLQEHEYEGKSPSFLADPDRKKRKAIPASHL